MSPYRLFAFRSRRSRALAPLAVVACAIALSGCHIDDGATDPSAALDYHARYPIVLAQSPTSLDVFSADGALDAQSLATIRAFVERYREFGAGRIAILSPSNRRGGALTAAIRKALYANGLRGEVAVGSYPNPDPTLVAPVRLVYQGITAKVRAACGNFPTDIASGDTLRDWHNLPYENYGCSTQKMLAAQIDDPRDLARARASGDSDVEMRLRAIENIRKGSDPGTNWKVQNTAIGSVGGN
jgi:pilus assembly protein CpaD